MAGLKCTEKEPYENINNVMESSKLPNIFLKLSGFYYVQDSPSKWEYPYSDAMWVYKKAYENFGAISGMLSKTKINDRNDINRQFNYFSVSSRLLDN